MTIIRCDFCKKEMTELEEVVRMYLKDPEDSRLFGNTYDLCQKCADKIREKLARKPEENK